MRDYLGAHEVLIEMAQSAMHKAQFALYCDDPDRFVELMKYAGECLVCASDFYERIRQ